MTTHEADRTSDYDSEENEEFGGSDDPTGEHYDRGTDTDIDVADSDSDMNEPGDEPANASSRDHDAVPEDTDGPEVADPELVGTDGANEPAEPEPASEAGRIDPGAVDRTPESDPLQKLAPVGPDAAMDPGTGSYQDRWGAVQAGFIDDPRRTVESAGALVAEIWDDIARTFTEEREGVDGRWQSTESSTDDLIVVMHDYRDLYGRLMDFTSS
jgi:hypothetical protein